MKLALLTRNPKLYSTERFACSCSDRRHDVMLVDPLLCYMALGEGTQTMSYRGQSLADFDAVLPRIGASFSVYGIAVVRQFETMGVYALNGADSLGRARDKFASLQLLAEAGIPIPATGFADATLQTDDLIDLVGGPPLVVKILEGTQGIGVVLAENRQAAQSVIEAFRGMRANILVQEFIQEAAGEDVRCLVLNGRVIAAMRRSGSAGDFRSNLHRGGVARPAVPTPQEERNAIRSAEALGLRFAGVDQLRSKRGPLVIEVNPSPGLEGIEGATGVDVAGTVIDFIAGEVEG